MPAFLIRHKEIVIALLGVLAAALGVWAAISGGASVTFNSTGNGTTQVGTIQGDLKVENHIGVPAEEHASVLSQLQLSELEKEDLKKQLAKESQMVRESSLEVLEVFDAFEDEISES